MSRARSASPLRRTPSVDADEAAVHLAGQLALVRHDLRNVLMPLMLHFDLLDLHAQGIPPAKAASPAELAATLHRLANGLLLRATAHAVGAPSALDLHRWWQDVGELLCTPLRQTRAIDVQINPQLPPVLAYPDVLAHVLLHVFVDIRLAQRVNAGPIIVAAQRSAQGVTLSIYDRVRPPRLPHSQPPDHLATRWGMSLASSLLQRAGCSLTGYCSHSDGTHVRVRLRVARPRGAPPMASDRKPEGMPFQHAVSPDGTAQRAEDRGTLLHKVLIIDDNAALTAALALRLELEGTFSCLPPLHTLRGSAEHIRHHQPHTVLLDLNMPGEEHPLDLIRTLRQREPGLRIIVLTGNPAASAIDATRRAGADAFVAKGVTPDRLLAVLRRAGDAPFITELDA